MRSYKTYLRSVGRKPIPRNVRTEKREGDLQIAYRDGEYQLHRYDEAGGKVAA